MAGTIYPGEKTYRYLPSKTITDHSATVVDQSGDGFNSLLLTIDISAFTGTSITFTLSGKDIISGNTYTILASAAKSATGTFTMLIGPSIVAAANTAANFPLPKKWRLVTSGTITSVTFSVSAELFNG